MNFSFGFSTFYRNSSSSRPGLERTESADQTGSAAEGPDDDFTSALSRSSSGGERKHGSTQISKLSSHGTPGPKATSCSRATQRSTPARPLTRDLAGKYGDPAASQVILQGSNSAGSQNPPPGDSTLGTLSQDRSPQSESICPVELPSSCDSGHNARLARKGSVQQSSVNQPLNSEHDPVTPGPGKPGNGLSTGTWDRDPVPSTQFHRAHRVNRVQLPHRTDRSHQAHRVLPAHRVIRSDQSTLVKKLNWKRPTSVWTSLSFLFLIHRADRCN